MSDTMHVSPPSIRPVHRDAAAPARPVDAPAPNARPRGARSDRAVRVDLSPAALEALANEEARETELAELRGRLSHAQREAEEEQRGLREQRAIRSGRELSESDEAALRELRQGDREIRDHEAAHLAAAGGLAGGLRLHTVTGPDGRQYAIGGSVKIDMSDAGSPEANEAKMRKVKAAAMAVAKPSKADMRVAGMAEGQLQKARRARAAHRYEARQTG